MSEVSQYRKRPVVIDAMRWDGSSASAAAVAAWVNSTDDGTDDPTATYLTTTGDDAFDFLVQTMEGGMTVSPGDFIIRGVKGEHYPCKPDIFAMTYEPAATPPAAPDEAMVGLLKGVTDSVDYLLRNTDDDYAMRHYRERLAALTAALNGKKA